MGGTGANANWATTGNWGAAATPANNFNLALVFDGTNGLSNSNTLTGGTAAMTSLTINFGSVNEGDTVSPQNFNLYNLLQTAGYTADLAIVSISETNAGGPLSTNLTAFNSLASGTFNTWQVFANTAGQGTSVIHGRYGRSSSRAPTAAASTTPTHPRPSRSRPA